MTTEQKEPKSRSFLSRILEILAVVALLMAITGGIAAFYFSIDRRIQNSVHDELFIRKVASHVRPSVIFDANETIHADLGAMQYLESIHVDAEDTNQPPVPKRVVVTPKQHLVYQPILEPLGLNRFFMETKRGPGHQWIYELQVHKFLDREEPTWFRLEIVK